MRLFLLLCLFSASHCRAQTHHLSGQIRDAASGETLPSASVLDLTSGAGALSNSYGYYSLALAPGEHRLEVRYVGYQRHVLTVRIPQTAQLDISLTPSGNQLQEVTVTGQTRSILPGQIGLTMDRVKAMPTLAGEPDVFKSLQYLPGIQAAVEGTSGLSVRGGSHDQTLVTLDEAPVYNASHALGFFSTFNPEAIKSLDVYKGLVPAQYGGRLSSVVDLKMKEGNNHEWKTTGAIGLIASRLTVEGPLQKDSASIILSGRYSYAGRFINLIGKAAQAVNASPFRDFSGGNDIRFYDLNAKVNWKAGRNHFFLSGYAGKDWFNYYLFERGTFLRWQNATASFRWNRVHSQRIFSNTTLYLSRYKYNYVLLNDRRDFDWKAGLTEVGLKREYDYFLARNASLKAGIHLTYTRYQPGSVKPRTDSSVTVPFELPLQRAVQAAVFGGYQRQWNRYWQTYAGVRVTTFALVGPGISYRYNPDQTRAIDSTRYTGLTNFRWGVEPRLSVQFSPDSVRSFTVSWHQSRQYVHLLSNSTAGLPTDMWMPSTQNIAPQQSTQVSVGYRQPVSFLTFSVEAYYKRMSGVIDFIDNAQLFVNAQVESQIRTGTGEAKGIEFLLEKPKGRWTGWLSYTLSKTERTIPGINQGLTYPSRYDHRHSISAVSSYDLTPKVQLSATFQYNTGGAVTLPAQAVEYNEYPVNYYSSRNGVRLPAFHRLDIQVSFSRRGGTRHWVVGLYNVYNRLNLFTVNIRPVVDDSSLKGHSEIAATSLYGIVPFVSYQFRF
ncbi:MAG: TonB-dependent receptor [Siphonobacter aquaeclarae]|nr:TonB-dependent receptor [Siphonobacter aquaeclarae]